MLFLFLLVSSCEIFVIKGNKIVIEEESSYSQKTALGVVKIFVTELQNENYLAASELLIKDSGLFLNASEKYAATNGLSRMKRFLEGKNVVRELNDKLTDYSYSVVFELDNGQKARFTTIKHKNQYYILDYFRE